jgi:hypothetical protein
MNKRIEELHKQAFSETKDYWATIDKFAELIVRECAQFIFVLDAEPVSHKSAARMLQDHFGVE